jgi:Na+/melibiose symporter-like transporter
LKYTAEEAFSEILRRKEQIMIRRDRRACQILSGATGILSALLLIVIAALPGKPEVIRDGSVYGAFLLSQEAGGYVMTAVIAFALGVAVTLLCLRLQKRNKQQGNDKDKRI